MRQLLRWARTNETPHTHLAAAQKQHFRLLPHQATAAIKAAAREIGGAAREIGGAAARGIGGAATSVAATFQHKQ